MRHTGTEASEQWQQLAWGHMKQTALNDLKKNKDIHNNKLAKSWMAHG